MNSNSPNSGEGTERLQKEKPGSKEPQPPPKQQYDGIKQGARLKTMSCSDKILKWNMCGVQGSLLSNFIGPLYMNSITIGFLFMHGHMARAACCRISEQVNEYLPGEGTTYKIHRFLS